ncbi:MAG: acetyl-CoA carboxylase biotin carboxyl carrier protein subunit [Weeksellaceae bacterium]|nr:acetyl-CoA carboxylase biotin carboxyl carrier protein subunit [Weeksellaceae bacterium]
MMKSFKINVKGQAEFDLNEEQIENLDAIHLTNKHYQVLEDNVSYQTEIISEDFVNRNYIIQVNHTDYEVEISTELDKLIKELGFEVGASKQVNAIKAPMPGLVLEINVEVGQEVQEGDNLLILEAMKMENSFTSPRAGIIKSIVVKKGQAVDKGQLLIEFE